MIVLRCLSVCLSICLCVLPLTHEQTAAETSDLVSVNEWLYGVTTVSAPIVQPL